MLHPYVYFIPSRATRAAGLMGNGHPVSANSDTVFGYQILLSEVLLSLSAEESLIFGYTYFNLHSIPTQTNQSSAEET